QSFQENSMLLFKDGSVFPFSENKKKYYDFDQSPGEIASGKLSKGEFLVLITDRILSPLGITNNSLLTGIKEKVASNKNFLKSSKDLTLGIAKYIDSVAKTKGIGHILDILSIIVIRRK
ncbi:MAG: hypothetical protein K8R21_16355, partial [Leptospira sp.]|nr:hypothetical protein [Leptospira sp.]